MERGIEVCLNQDATDPRTYQTVEVRGISAALSQELRAPAMTEARWRALLQVFLDLGENPPIEVAPILGAYEVEDELIRFSPRYPWIEGQRYHARFMHDGIVSASFAIPKRAAAPTRILQVYPSADVLPENLLRFYIYFSAPMREGEALRHIQLLDSEGQNLDGVFLDRVEELWDPTGTRLTLLFDPGRVKTGLVAHERLGRALDAGRSYRLLIDALWRDARGEPLGSPAEKQFLAAPAKQSAPDVSAWRLRAPKSGTNTPLSIRFPDPLDHALLLEFLQVRRADDSVVRGDIALGAAETLWEFRPWDVWAAGDYAVHVDTRLEDVAGNNLNGLFDRPISQRPGNPSATISLRFHVP